MTPYNGGTPRVHVNRHVIATRGVAELAHHLAQDGLQPGQAVRGLTSHRNICMYMPDRMHDHNQPYAGLPKEVLS